MISQLCHDASIKVERHFSEVGLIMVKNVAD